MRVDAEDVTVTRSFVISLLALAAVPFHSSIQPLPGAVRWELRHGAWHPGCPVALSDLRVLSVSYRGFDRSRHRPGMVTAAVVRAFRSIGWGWGGSWSGSTKDYMHFSASGH